MNRKMEAGLGPIMHRCDRMSADTPHALPIRTTAGVPHALGVGFAHGAPARQRGITLIEILVAVVLTAVGLLGLAGLQLRGIQVNQGSSMRSLAAIMAEDLADRMRSDYAALAAGSFIGTYTLSNLGSAPVTSLNDWLYGLQALPAGTAAANNPVPCANVLPCVQIVQLTTATGNPPHPVQIQIWWNDARATVASTAGVAIAGAGVTPTNMVGTYKTVAELTESY